MAEITQTLRYTANKDLRAVMTGQVENIAIGTSWGDGVEIDNRHLSLTTLTIQNLHATNTFEYSVWGHLDDNSGTIPAFDTSWAELPKPNCPATVSADTTVAETLTENWAWLRIRLRRSGGVTTATIRLRSRQSRY